MTRSLSRARELLGLDNITVVYPGDKDYALADNIRVRGLKGYLPGSGKYVEFTAELPEDLQGVLSRFSS